MRTLAAGLAGAMMLAAGTVAAADCGGDVPCRVPEGSYRIALPDGGAKGVYLFFHGYRGSAAGEMKNAALIATAHAHGLAFAAVDGRDGTWSHPGSPEQSRDETAFVGSVLDDLSTRFGFGPDAVIVGGFSQGGSMAWYTACALGDRIAGAVTFAGVFWRPLPAASDCVAPPPWVHVHGLGDRTFPLAGRPIGKRWHQGDSYASLSVIRSAGACRSGTQAWEAGDLACSETDGCRRGAVALCLHGGGHELRAAWLDAALSRLGW